ncbi:hypothetical protein H4R33_007099, partial [Dimargaris cristalligena]
LGGGDDDEEMRMFRGPILPCRMQHSHPYSRLGGTGARLGDGLASRSRRGERPRDTIGDFGYPSPSLIFEHTLLQHDANNRLAQILQ